MRRYASTRLLTWIKRQPSVPCDPCALSQRQNTLNSKSLRRTVLIFHLEGFPVIRAFYKKIVLRRARFTSAPSAGPDMAARTDRKGIDSAIACFCRAQGFPGLALVQG